MILDSLKQAISLLLGSSDVWMIILRSFEVSGIAVILAAVVGIPLGTVIAITRFRGRGPLVSLINTGMALPPVVIGLVVYMLLSRTGPLGSLHLLYTKQAMVAAQMVLAVPLVLGITVSGVAGVPRDALDQARSLGSTRLQTAMLALSEARMVLVLALVAATGRVVAEVGAVMMVGGNFPGDTQVMTTAIMENVSKGEYSLGLALGAILLAIAFAANSVMARIQHREMTVV